MVDNNINVVKLTNSIFIIQNLFPFEDCDKYQVLFHNLQHFAVFHELFYHFL